MVLGQLILPSSLNTVCQSLTSRSSASLYCRVRSAGVVARFFVIALTAFLTVVDLFATKAILPSLTQAYGVSPAAMGSAVNASTIGMAIAGLGVAILSRKIDRRLGILVSLAVLAIPTALLASAPNLAAFTVLRVVQGLCMATAFTLTLAYLGEHPSAIRNSGLHWPPWTTNRHVLCCGG